MADRAHTGAECEQKIQGQHRPAVTALDAEEAGLKGASELVSSTAAGDPGNNAARHGLLLRDPRLPEAGPAQRIRLMQNMQRTYGNSYAERVVGQAGLASVISIQRQDVPPELLQSVDITGLSDAALDRRLLMVRRVLLRSNASSDVSYELQQEEGRLAEERRGRSAQRNDQAEIDIGTENVQVQLGTDFIDYIVSRIKRETIDIGSIPSTAGQAGALGNTIHAASRGFRIQHVIRNGQIYYHIHGERGAFSGITGRRYAAANLGRSSLASVKKLSELIHWRTALQSGALSRSNILLTLAGTTLDYAVDPEKELGSQNYLVDAGFDITTAAAASSVGTAAGAWATTVLATMAFGASAGSVVPIVGTAVGIVVGLGVAIAIKAMTEDLRQGMQR